MDFEKILHVARKNELNKKEPVKCLQTKFKPPTKEQHEKDKLLSEGVQRFLARKEEEEKRKQMEAERRKLELMALRAKDPKANKRIQTMLKRTKSANKSVMEDAVDNNNTADTLAGPSQPDEDDYGFVSETSSQLYNKLIQKMYSTPSDDLPKFAPSKKPTCGNLSNTKERVKMALLKQEEEDRLPHKRKKKSKGLKEEDEEEGLNYSAPDRDISKVSPEPKGTIVEKKIRKPMPPPVDFHELLKIAEQKQHEPIPFEPKVKKPQEPEMLMTKKQKLEYERMQEWKKQREIRLQNLESGGDKTSLDDKKIPRIPKLNQSASESSQKVPANKKPSDPGDKSVGNKFNSKSQDKNEKGPASYKSKDASDKSQKVKQGSDVKNTSQKPNDKKKRDEDDERSRLIRERDEALRLLKEKEKLIRERDEAVRKLKEKEQLIKERDEVVRKLKLLEESEKSSLKNASHSDPNKQFSSQKKVLNGKPVGKPSGNAVAGSSKTDQILPKAKIGVKQGVREFPPRDLKPLSKPVNGAHRNIQRSKQFPPAEVRRKAMALKRRRIESDDEYDSELDDFIDDDTNDIGSEEVSKVISEIFRYDKNKYSRYDDLDDECMESNYAQISKEEYFSTKCGILEDLKDIQREKAKLARKQKR